MYSRSVKKTRGLTGKVKKKQFYRGKGSGQCCQSLLKAGEEEGDTNKDIL